MHIVNCCTYPLQLSLQLYCIAIADQEWIPGPVENRIELTCPSKALSSDHVDGRDGIPVSIMSEAQAPNSDC